MPNLLRSVETVDDLITCRVYSREAAPKLLATCIYLDTPEGHAAARALVALTGGSDAFVDPPAESQTGVVRRPVGP